jgi:hypothetical protein
LEHHQAAHTPKVGIDNEFVPNIHYWGFSVFRISFCLWIMVVGSTKHAGCQWQQKSVMIHDSITSSPKQTKRRIESNGFQIFCRILLCNLTLLTSGPYGFTAILKLSWSLVDVNFSKRQRVLEFRWSFAVEIIMLFIVLFFVVELCYGSAV